MRLRALAALCLTASMLTTSTGCYGRFPLLSKVYEINGSVENKFLRSALFWAFVIIPVYGVTAFVDAIFLNVIEFWTGERLMSSLEHENEDGSVTQLVRVDADTVRVRHLVDGQVVEELELVRAGDTAAFVRAPSGELLYQVEQLGNGGLAVREQGSIEARLLTPDEVNGLADSVARGELEHAREALGLPAFAAR